MSDEAPLRGDMARREVVATRDLDWTPSPSGTVWRRRLHRVGPAEAGQVTSIVRYEPEASFPAHDHPEGEEILVLEGVFSDEHGDWPAGTYLLNPEGFRHAPFSREGCTLFVKLRQAPGEARRHVALQTEGLQWQPGKRPGVETKALHAQSEFADETRLERWAASAALDEIQYPGGAELFVLDGAFRDDDGAYESGTWLRLPPGSAHRPATDEGCTVYVKTGGVAELRAAQPDASS